MRRQIVRIDLAGKSWAVRIDSRPLSWLFHKLFTVEVFGTGSGVTRPERSEGRVTKVTAPPEYNLKPRPNKGGRVTKAMPRQLRKIKEGQESNDT